MRYTVSWAVLLKCKKKLLPDNCRTNRSARNWQKLQDRHAHVPCRILRMSQHTREVVSCYHVSPIAFVSVAHTQPTLRPRYPHILRYYLPADAAWVRDKSFGGLVERSCSVGNNPKNT